MNEEFKECIRGFVAYSRMDKKMEECRRCSFMNYMSGDYGFISKEWIIDSIKEMDDIDFHDIFDVVRERHNNHMMGVKNE